MPNVRIRGQDVDIDVEAELRQYDWGSRVRWSTGKLQAASPFRYEHTPSFFVNLDGEYAGTWADLGAYDSDWQSGNFVKLLAFLRQETYEETESYLLAEYGRLELGNELTIKAPKLRMKPAPQKTLAETLVTPAVSPYLLGRGISAEVQTLAGVGYGKQRGFTAIPWRTPAGSLANVMYRATRGKVFFYETGGWPIGKLVYGIDLIQRQKDRVAVLCEAPIDALTWRTAGYAALSVGGVNITDEQADIIRRSPIETLILGGDNDAAGAKLNAAAERLLRGHVRLKRADYGEAKDANDYFLKEGGNLPKIGGKVLPFPAFRAYN